MYALNLTGRSWLIISLWFVGVVYVLYDGLFGHYTGTFRSAKQDWSDPGFIKTMKVLRAISSITIFLIPAVAFARLVAVKKPLQYFGDWFPLKSYRCMAFAVLLSSPRFPVVKLLGDDKSLHSPSQMDDGPEKDTSNKCLLF